MMHKVKKSFHKRTAPEADLLPSATFQDYRQRLDLVKRNIALLDEKITDANDNMTRMMMAQRSFSEKFADGYPLDLDETHAIAVEFKNGIADVYDYYVRQTSSEVASYTKMHQQVKAYLLEIQDVEALYKPLEDARAEVSRYQKKVDSLHTANEKKRATPSPTATSSPNAPAATTTTTTTTEKGAAKLRSRTNRHLDMKKTRNIEKLDAEREKLDKLTQDTVLAQKRTFAKAPIVHKIALCAYWVSYRTHTLIMMKSLEKTEEFAVANEASMAQLDISKISPDLPHDVAPTAAADLIHPSNIAVPRSAHHPSDIQSAVVTAKEPKEVAVSANTAETAVPMGLQDKPLTVPLAVEANNKPPTDKQPYSAKNAGRLNKLRIRSFKGAKVAS